MIDKEKKGQLLKVAKAILLILLFLFIAYHIKNQWSELVSRADDISPHWGWLTGASVVVLITYAALIQAWRTLLKSAGENLGFISATRIWTIANLGRYIPGKIWSVGALMVLARDRGVSPQSAAGAAIIGTIINIGSGFVIVAVLGNTVLTTLDYRYRLASSMGAALFLIMLLFLPRIIPYLYKLFPSKKTDIQKSFSVSAPTILTVTLINLLSWLGYGIAFSLLIRGLIPSISSEVAIFITIWTVSYLIGYLTLIAPGGIGTRDAALVVAMVSLGLSNSADATLIAVFSRLWLTILEVLPGLVSLAMTTLLRRFHEHA